MTEGLRIAGLRSQLAGPFDLEIAPGSCVAVTGASGSGKSLFLRMVADLDPGDGEVWLNGRARSTMAPPEWRRHVVYCPADSGWWLDRVGDHFHRDMRDFVRRTAPRLNLPRDLLDGPVSRLSTGERQRLALLRAFALASPVLLLDEPTGPLDRDSVARVEELLRERLAEGVALLLVTHDPTQAARLDARHFVMANRRLEAT